MNEQLLSTPELQSGFNPFFFFFAIELRSLFSELTLSGSQFWGFVFSTYPGVCTCHRVNKALLKMRHELQLWCGEIICADRSSPFVVLPFAFSSRHLQRFWGASGDFWQDLWTKLYVVFEGHDAALFYFGGHFYFSLLLFLKQRRKKN